MNAPHIGAFIVLNHNRNLFSLQDFDYSIDWNPPVKMESFCRVSPQAIRTDKGKEFCGSAMLNGAHRRVVKLFLIEPGKSNQNAYIESFNKRFPDECLNEYWFINLPQAKIIIEAWRRQYNEERPKKALVD